MPGTEAGSEASIAYMYKGGAYGIGERMAETGGGGGGIPNHSLVEKRGQKVGEPGRDGADGA